MLQANDADKALLIRLVKFAISEGGSIVEVGSYTGGSALLIAEAIEGVGKLTCVESGNTGHLDTLREKFKEMEHVHILGLPSLDACSHFEDESLDLVYLDADHRYKSIYADCKMWWDKVKYGGILCGHDCQIPFFHMSDVDKIKLFAVAKENTERIHGGEYVKYNTSDKPWWRDNEIHPGVIIAVHELFGNNVRLLGNGSSIWYIHKTTYDKIPMGEPLI